VAAGSHAARVLDGYHIAAALPALTPIETSGNITVFYDYDDIVDKTGDAWNFFDQDPKRIASITTRTWATVNN
jgi:hypothetical protein